METRLSDWDIKLLVEIKMMLIEVELNAQIPNSVKSKLKKCREYIKEVMSPTYIAQI